MKKEKNVKEVKNNPDKIEDKNKKVLKPIMKVIGKPEPNRVETNYRISVRIREDVFDFILCTVKNEAGRAIKFIAGDNKDINLKEEEDFDFLHEFLNDYIQKNELQ